MDENSSFTFTKHGHTRPIDEDQCNMANSCVTCIIDYDDSAENINLLIKPQPTSERTTNANRFKNAEVTHDKIQNHVPSAKSLKVLSPRVDSASETHVSTKIHVRSDSSDENSTDKKERSSKKQSIEKRCKGLSPYIFVVLFNILVSVAVSVGLYYILDNVNGTRHVSAQEPMFVNLKVNFDSYSQKIHNTSGKIPWTFLAASFLILDETGTNITVLQSGSYSIDVSLNFDNKRNKDPSSISMCILNSIDSTYERCTPEVIPARIQRSVTVRVDLNLKKGDSIWVNVNRVNLVYKSSNANHMTIRKY